MGCAGLVLWGCVVEVSAFCCMLVWVWGGLMDTVFGSSRMVLAMVSSSESIVMRLRFFLLCFVRFGSSLLEVMVCSSGCDVAFCCYCCYNCCCG